MIYEFSLAGLGFFFLWKTHWLFEDLYMIFPESKLQNHMILPDLVEKIIICPWLKF